MGHGRSFSQFFTDMRTHDAWQTIFVKILLMLEMLWTLIVGCALIIQYGIIETTQPDELSTFLLLLGHLGTPLTLITMLSKMEHGLTASWLKAWWIIVCHLLDARAIYEASKATFTATSFDTRTFLLVMSSLALVMSFVTLLVFALAKWAPFNQKVDHTDASGHYQQQNDSEAPLPPNRDDIPDGGAARASQINASYGGGTPGVVSVRFPQGKFVHQPARKGD
jgi:hypothetical protein